MKKNIKIFFFVSIFGIFSFSTITLAEISKIEKNLKLHNLPINNKRKIFKNNQKKLIPLPLPKIEIASKSVNSERNPFSTLRKNFEMTEGNKNKNFIIKGIIKTGNQLRAMLKSDDGLSLFSEGDYVNNDFKIKQILLNDESIIFTDGNKEFKLVIGEE